MMKMSEILRAYLDSPPWDDSPAMYVVATKCPYYSVSHTGFRYPSETRSSIPKGCYILPSSIHECLAVGWHLARKHDVDLTLTAFRKAYASRNVRYGLIFHSDQGFKNTAFVFRNLMDSLDIVQSFSKKGYPFDNACCESFFKYLKKNLTNRRTYRTAEELCLALFDYIERLYNNLLPRWSIGYKTPNEYEAEYWDQYA